MTTDTSYPSASSELRIATVVLLLSLMIAAPLGAADRPEATPPSEESPEALAIRFLEAFVEQDFGFMESLLTPDAKIQWAWLENPDNPILETFTVTEWLDRQKASHPMIDGMAIEIQESVVHSHDTPDATTVSLRFRVSGAVQGRHFFNDGVDTMAFVRRDGVWRIALSTSIQNIVFRPRDPTPAEGGSP